MTETRVAVVGAGPAGLSASRYLMDRQGFSVELFESGRNSNARICPVDRAMPCNGCAGSCNVLSGVGGCIQPGDSIKLSAFPSGRRLLEKIGSTNASIAQSLAMEFFSVLSADFTQGVMRKFGNLELRHYPIHEIDPVGVWKLHERFSSIAKAVDQYHPRFSVSMITRTDDGFELTDATNKRFAGYFDKVIIATGRSGFNSLSGSSGGLRITTIPPNISLGIRLELPARMLESMFQAHRDFKFTKVYGKQKVKSFCFSSSAAMGGRLKFCHYPNQFDFPVTLLDGHANYENSPVEITSDEPRGNLGLLVQLPKELGSDWLNRNFLRRYYDGFAGKPVAQSIRGFVERTRHDDQITVSVEDVIRGNVSSLFDCGHHAALSAAILDVVRGLSQNSSFSANEIVDSGTCIGPEVEFFWPTADVSEYLQTSEQGLYVVGDALGIAQGNFQAAVSGFVAAQGIAAGEGQHLPDLIAAE